jgi:hypothetical protein
VDDGTEGVDILLPSWARYETRFTGFDVKSNIGPPRVVTGNELAVGEAADESGMLWSPV